MSLQKKADISADAKAWGGPSLDQNNFHVPPGYRLSPGLLTKEKPRTNIKSHYMAYTVYHM